MTPRTPLVARIAVGIVAVSFGAIFIRLAGEAPSFAIAAWRLALAALCLLPIAFARRGRTLTSPTLAWSVASGVALALHFVLWIASLRLTSVASSTVFVSTHPLFVALGSLLFLRERLPRSLALGIVFAVAGGTLIGFGDARAGTASLSGDLLALAGGLTAAVYFLIGRHVRKTVSALEYAAVSYTTAAGLVLLLCLLTETPVVGFSLATYGCLVLLALVPQMVGHSTLNWALKHLSASKVSVLVLAEPIGAAILAIFIFREVPTTLILVGGAIILLGIYASLRSKEDLHVHGS